MNLTECFKVQIPSIRSELMGLRLPADSEKVERIISSKFSQLLESDGEFRQNLTQSEDYILQAALSLLHAQQEITMNLVKTQQSNQKVPMPLEGRVSFSNSKEKPSKSFNDVKVSAQNSVFGSAGGALVGNVLFGGWGAVFGAIAGTALVIYVSSIRTSDESKNINESQKIKTTASVSSENDSDSTLDVDKFIAIIEQICDSVDNLIETFRAQIKRVVNKYESQEKPSIERDFRTLLEGIQSLIGYKRGHNPEDVKYTSKLQTRIEDIAEILDNYNLEAVDYSSEHSEWFEIVESPNAEDIKMVTPAIVKGNVLILKGKIFIPQG